MFPWTKASAFKSLSILTAVFLAACGGGGDSSSTDTSTSTSSSTTIALSPGVFDTEIAYDSGGTESAISVLSPTGNFVSVVSDSDITVGNLQFGSGQTVTGTGTDVFYSGSWQTTSGSLNGTVQSTEAATARATAPGYESTVTLARDNAFSDRGVTLAELNDTFSMSSSGVVTAITIAADGTVTGSDDTNCAFNGELTIPDTAYNVFEVSYTASNCGDSQQNGDFTGVGAYDADNSELQFAGTDGEVAVVFIGTK